MLTKQQVEEILALMYDQKHCDPSEKEFLWRQLQLRIAEAISDNPTISCEDAYAYLRRECYPEYAKRRRRREWGGMA